jgi:hypothetical protein
MPKKVLTVAELASRGGTARWKGVSKKERSQAAADAAKARWAAVRAAKAEAKGTA